MRDVIRRLIRKNLPVPLSVLLAAVFLYPMAAYALGTVPRVGWFIYMPAIGLDYLCVFFHEIGHAVTGTLFGAPGFPTFDVEFGGGYTPTAPREWSTQVIVWAVMIAGIIWLHRHDGILWARLAAGIFVFLLLFSFSDAWENLFLFMGHGTEILIGCFCLFRGLTNSVEGGEHSSRLVERYLNLIFGFYALGRNAVKFAALAFDEDQRAIYDMQKGGYMLGDLRRIAESLAMPLETVAMASLAFLAAMFAFTLWFSNYWGLRIEDEEA